MARVSCDDSSVSLEEAGGKTEALSSFKTHSTHALTNSLTYMGTIKHIGTNMQVHMYVILDEVTFPTQLPFRKDSATRNDFVSASPATI